MTVAVSPYGTWRSPIGADLVARATTRVHDPRIAGGAVWWLERRPTEGGRTVIVRADAASGTSDVTPAGFDARSLVHEYGGGAFEVAGTTVYFSNFEDQRLYRQESGSAPVPITAEPPRPRSVRYADMSVSPDGRWIACVRERHAAEHLPENEVVVLPADGSADPVVVGTGSDFCSSPRWSPDGSRLAWLRWNMPWMPWDESELVVAPMDDGRPGDPELLAGGDREALYQPSWSPDGTLHVVSDRTGWWNIHRLSEGGTATNLTPIDAEFGVPMWLFGYSSYSFLEDGRITCAYRRDGVHHLALLDPSSGELLDLDVPYTCFDPPYVRAEGSSVAFAGSNPTTMTEVVLLDFTSRSVEVLRDAQDLGIDDDHISVAEPIRFETSGGRSAHAYYYGPRNPGFKAPDGELPPLVVHAHGGPTSESTPELDPQVQYFTSRGFAYVDVNYGGSSGYGREYRDRLYGQWGVVDVEDCIAAAEALASDGRADGSRVVVTGGSAGGYIVLAALAFHPRSFAAGTSYYGLADLEPFASSTHKFELKYTDLLVGPWPEAAELWRERSPITKADAIERPVLLLQGLEDAVVPPEQAEIMIEALERRGVPYAYLPFEGEQHGFRRAESIVRSLEAELAFYARILGFEPADRLPTLEIRNLPS